MMTLGWMQKRFRNTNGKSCSCFSALWDYPEANNNSRQPVALGVEITNEEDITEMKPEFFLAIGTLGSVIVTKDPITSEAAAIDGDEETSAAENELQFLNNKSAEDVLEKEKKNIVAKEYYEMPATKEAEKEQKTTLVKKKATSNKRSGKGVKRDTHVFHYVKKMLRKLDFASRCSTDSALRSNAISCDSTQKKPIQAFRNLRKIHPEATDIQVKESHKCQVKKMCYNESYNKEVTSDEEDGMRHQAGMFKKETISRNHRPFNVQPDGRKPHWIKTDADYFVLEF